jgi:hemolysin activation/secretion protein
MVQALKSRPILNVRTSLDTGCIDPSQRAIGLSLTRRAVWWLIAACWTGGAAAQQAGSAPAVASSEPRFTIQRFEIAGAKLVKPAALDGALASLTGANKRFADIETALQAVRDVYERAGITAMQVFIPEQALEAGVVKLQVEELQVQKVEVVGARARSPANIRRAVPSLKEGTTPVDALLAAELRLANENPGREMQVTFRAEEGGGLTGVLRVADRSPLVGQVTLDNTGSGPTGKYRLGAVTQHNNLLDRDLVGTLQLQTSPGHEGEVQITAFSLRAPWYRAGITFDANFSYSSVDSGTVKTAAGDYLISSSGLNAALRATRLLPRLGEWEPRISAGWDFKHVDSRVTSSNGGPSLVPDIWLLPASISLAAKRRGDQLAVSGQINLSHNVPGSGRSAASVFAEPGLRAGANPRYLILRANLAATWDFGAKGSMTAQWNGQWSRDSLVPAEQFSIGGMGSVRGFNGRGATGDVGQRVSLEWSSPMKRLREPWRIDGGWQVFAETAQAQRNNPLPEEIVRTQLASIGAGLRLTWREQFNLRADVGVIAEGAQVAKRGEHYVHASIGYAF